MQDDGGVRTRFGSLLRWLLFAALACAAGFVVCRQIIISRLDEEIRARFEARLAAHYTDLEVRVQGARRIEGKGIEIRGLSIRSLDEGTAYRDILFIDEMFLQCRADLSELIGGHPKVRRLVVRRMKLHATCHEDGRWNTMCLFPPPDFGGSVPSIVLEDSTVELQDLRRQLPGVLTLRSINVKGQLQTDAEGEEKWRLTGKLQGDHFKHVQLNGVVDARRGNWSAWGTIDGLEMSQQLLNALPDNVAQYVSVLATLRARAHFEFRLGYEAGATDPIRAEVHGHIADGRVDDPRLPLPLTELEADVHGNNKQIRIENVTARSGQAKLELKCICDEFLGAAPQLQLVGSIANLSLDKRLYAVLSPKLQGEWDKFAPAGVIDAAIDVRMTGNQWVPNVTVTCRDVSFAYHKFPLRMRQGKGVIQWLGDTVFVRDFAALAGNKTVYISGQFQHPGPQAVGWLDLRSGGPLALDEELFSAFTESGQKIVRSMHPSGSITLTHGRFEKTTPDGPPSSRWEFTLSDCSIEHDKFPYSIHKITGRLVLANRRWDFVDLHGYHGSSYIACEGGWVPAFLDQPGGDLTLKFKCWDVALNDSLRHAVGKLNQGAEQFWNSMHPRGTVDYANILFQLNSLSKKTHFELLAEKWPPGQNVEGRSISVHPSWFPLRLDECTGRVWFSDGKFALKNVTAKRGDSRVELAGHGNMLPNHQWEITLSRLIADTLQVDHPFIDALPVEMRTPVRQLKYRGTLSLNGNAWFRGGEGQPLLAGWDVLLDIENGAIDNELKLEHIYGGVRLTGNKNVRGFQSHGALDIDSLMTRGVQVTQVHGPLRLDPQQMLLGSAASVVRRGQPPQQVTAKAMGGSAALDARILFDEQLHFAVDVSVADATIAEFARSFHAQQHNISGKVYALLRLKGAKAGFHTLQGTGQVRLREADIYQLPVMVSLLKILYGRPPDATGFTSSDIDFRLVGEQIYVDRVDFSGDAISLKGKGEMNFDGKIDLDFYALVGRQEFQLPFVSTLLAEASKNILAIQVTGDINNPQVTRRALPELDDTLQRLFPEDSPRSANPNSANSRAVLPIPIPR